MNPNKPFRRTFRQMKPAVNSGYSQWAYIRDRDYATNAIHYVRAFLLIQDDLKRIFEFIEPSDENESVYSFRIHELYMRTCIEIEANFRAIMEDNKYTPQIKNTNMTIYKKVDVSHRLSSYRTNLPIWTGTNDVFSPFASWKTCSMLSWYQDYNESKHNRQTGFKKANLSNLLNAVSGLLILLSAQFRTEEFSAASDVLGTSGHGYHIFDPAIGSMFRIEFPNDWPEAEQYDFDWIELRKQDDKFARFDYDA